MTHSQEECLVPIIQVLLCHGCDNDNFHTNALSPEDDSEPQSQGILEIT